VIARQRSWADSTSLNTMARAAAGLPAPRVTLVRSLTVEKVDSLESLNARYRRAANASGHFPNEQAALKRLYLTTLALDPTGSGRQRWSNRWKGAMNAFDTAFDGRLSLGRA
jgi:hypothetical protein